MLKRSFEVKYDSEWLVAGRPAKDIFCGDIGFLEDLDAGRQRGFTLCLTLYPFGADYTLKKDRIEDDSIVYRVKGNDKEVKVNRDAMDFPPVMPGTVYAKVLPLPIQKVVGVPKNNSIMSLLIYWSGHAWVFDAPEHRLYQEPFVCGADDMISMMVKRQKLEDPQGGFTAIFSAQKFPTAQYELVWEEEASGGNYYRLRIAVCDFSPQTGPERLPTLLPEPAPSWVSCPWGRSQGQLHSQLEGRDGPGLASSQQVSHGLSLLVPSTTREQRGCSTLQPDAPDIDSGHLCLKRFLLEPLSTRGIGVRTPRHDQSLDSPCESGVGAEIDRPVPDVACLRILCFVSQAVVAAPAHEHTALPLEVRPRLP